MVRCARGTCSREAVAGLGYDPVARSIWLVDLPGDDHQVLALCAGHADNLTVPHGWDSHDERSGEPRFWSFAPSVEAELEVAAASPPTRIDHARARREIVVEELELFGSSGGEADASSTDDGASEDAPIEVGARGSLIPGVDAVAETAELHVDDGTPLLARAFRASSVG